MSPIQLRFAVGARVRCQVSPQQWLAGRVVQHGYKEEDWPAHTWAAYQCRISHPAVFECANTVFFAAQDLMQLLPRDRSSGALTFVARYVGHMRTMHGEKDNDVAAVQQMVKGARGEYAPYIHSRAVVGVHTSHRPYRSRYSRYHHGGVLPSVWRDAWAQAVC